MRKNFKKGNAGNTAEAFTVSNNHPQQNETNLTQQRPLFNTWMDKQDIMQEFHISERTLCTWRKKKYLPFVPIGKKIYYNRSLLEKMLLEALNTTSGT